MRQGKAVSAIVRMTVIFLLLAAVPVAFAGGGGRGGGGGVGSGGRAGGFSGGGIVGGSRSGATAGGSTRSGVIGSGTRAYNPTPRSEYLFPHHPFHRDKFFFSFGATTFVPGWWWYGPYSHYWVAPASYTYYGYPYPDYYYGYFDYWSDPCLLADPAYAPYCPPTATNPYYQGYNVPPVDYPSPPMAPPESGITPQSPTQPEEPSYPVIE